jgi:Flp pilus assembly protein TadD
VAFSIKRWQSTIYVALLCAAVAVVYSFGLHNELIFDDARLTEGTVIENYGSLTSLKLRLLSYGSFNWVQALAGESMPAQRVINITLHLATCWAIYQLFAQLIPRITYSEETKSDTGFLPSQMAALRVGTLVYALHPVATYAVGYLIQRSIVMATLFGVLACWAFVRGVAERKWVWHLLAVLFYVVAVLSKEHAFLFLGLILPLYVFVARPSWQRASALFALTAALLIVATVVLLNLFPDMVGRIFDTPSRELAAQLDRQRPGALGQIYPLSVLNEAALFFYYGALWLLPYGGWMSIDMHPPFPLTFGAMPHIFGALAYLALLVVSVIAVLRKNDVRGFLGLCMLFPLLLYWTEFATVWVQDPFVLYRSYLWAIPIPAFIAILLTGFSPSTLYKLAVVLALALGAASVERIMSMRNDRTVWTDAVDKSNVPGVANAVGRARPFMNRGMAQLKRLDFEPAMRDFNVANSLGAAGGEALFAMGMTQHALGRPAEALQFLQKAEAAGYSNKLLHFHRGESEFVMGLYEKAILSYTQALDNPSKEIPVELAHAHRAESEMRIQKYAEAKADFETLLKLDSKQPRYRVGLGLARLGLKDAAGALETFNGLVQIQPDALAFYGRALAQHNLGNKAAATQDIARAVELEPSNPAYKQVQESIKKGEELSL